MSDTVSIPGLNAQVRSLLKYYDYLLIGTYGQGFICIRTEQLKMPLDKNGFLFLIAHCFMPDDRYGYCWISTNNFLSRKQSLEALQKAYDNDYSMKYAINILAKTDGILNTNSTVVASRVL